MSSQWTVANSYLNLLTYILNKIFDFLLWHAGMDNCSDEAPWGGAKLPPILLALLGPSCPPTTPVHNKKELIFSHFFDNEKLAKSSPNKRKRKKYSNLH